MSNISAIYVRLPNWIGDACMTLPCLQALLNTNLPIVVCARPWAKQLLAGYELAGFVEIKGHWREDCATLRAYRKKSRHLHVRGLLLPDSLSSALVFKFAGIPSVGYRDDGRSLILRWPINKPAKQIHAVQSWYYLTLHALERWNLPTTGMHTPPTSLGLKIADEHQTEGLAILNTLRLKPGHFILIAPTATGLHRGKVKVWPGWNQLTLFLQEKGYIVAMCPPPSEIDEAKRNAPTALCLPAVNLGVFATLTRLARLVICNDSGVSHIAAAANAQQLTLFGVTEPKRTGPWSKNAKCLGSQNQWPSLIEVQEQVATLLLKNLL